MHLAQNCQVVAVEGNVLTLGFTNAGARDSFDNGGSAEIVRQAAIDVVGADWRIETIVDPGAKADVPPPRAATPPAPAEPSGPEPAPDPQAAAPSGPPAWASDDADPESPESSAPAPSAAAPAPPRPERRTGGDRGRARRDPADPTGRRHRAGRLR